MEVFLDYTLTTSKFAVIILSLLILYRCLRSMLSEKYESEIWGHISCQGESYTLTHWENLIGRSISSDIRLCYPGVSRCHAVPVSYTHLDVYKRQVQRIEFQGESSILADPLYLKRVVDNLVSNVMKYGDRAKHVMMISELKGGYLSLCISNAITRNLVRGESSKIGLRTCKRIMEQMHGSFSIENDGEHF